MSRDWEPLFCVPVALFTVLIAGFFAGGIDVAVLGDVTENYTQFSGKTT